MTCKFATKRDFLYLSPEAAAAVMAVGVRHDFAEHATVIATLSVPILAERVQRWPLPAEIPWDQVDIDAWHHEGSHQAVQGSTSSTHWLCAFSQSLESSLNGFVTGRPDKLLPSNCRGRASRTRPREAQLCPVTVRPSRPGEERLRHDFLSQELKRWFVQLRRLQSLQHALRASNPGTNACIYRASLWHSIRTARGFKGGFCSWWRTRTVQLQGSPPSLPEGLPSLDVVSAMFVDYRENFRRFETWSLRKRSQVLTDKYQQSNDHLYRQLRTPAAPQVDTLQLRHCYTVVSVDESSRQVQVDSPIRWKGTSSWFCDGSPVSVSEVDDDHCAVSGTVLLTKDSEIVQTQILSSVSDLQAEFVSLWSSRWQQHDPSCPPDWTRLLAFARAFMPRSPFQVAPLNVDSWLRQVRRFKPRSARGPDGFSKEDLLRMPRSKVEELLSLLQLIEDGHAEWPEQLLLGFVIALAKPNKHQDAQGFRPICLFSVIYRTWASLRARDLIRWLSGLLDPDTMGFLPNRSALDLWTTIQCEVELCLQGGGTSTGFCSDISKAFNNLPRAPLLQTAAHMGCPAQILIPWSHFLAGVRRRFVVRDALSTEIFSNSGFPEGDPLSPAAMLIANGIYHAYMKVSVGSIRALSYADNYSGVGHTDLAVIHGLNAAKTCSEMMGLELDQGKTYVWSTDAGQRARLRALDYTVLDHTRELGGFLRFGKGTRNAGLVRRCQELAPLWQTLSKSRSPLHFKLRVIPSLMWARCLHGVMGCPLSDGHIAKLRASAARAIDSRPSGSSGMLRLAVTGRLEVDPGFYVIWSSLLDFRRCLSAQPGMLLDWQLFMARFDGQLFQGPFSRMVVNMNALGWNVLRPPEFQDHEGLVHHFTQIPHGLLRQLVEHAWLQRVIRLHTHRKTMHDAVSIEPSLLFLDSAQLYPLPVWQPSSLEHSFFRPIMPSLTRPWMACVLVAGLRTTTGIGCVSALHLPASERSVKTSSLPGQICQCASPIICCPRPFLRLLTFGLPCMPYRMARHGIGRIMRLLAGIICLRMAPAPSMSRG